MNCSLYELKCPICNRTKSVGSCGHNRFFCRECCVEIKVKKDRIEVYEVTEDGGAILVKVINK